jgi:iron(III) transport system substrate-binding protein
MKKLSEQNLHFRTGKFLLTQLLAAGEFSIVVMTSGHVVEYLKRQGAPLEWVATEPIITTLMPIMVASHAPHPNAAKLFVDYVLSKEGQEIIRSVNRIPLRPEVPPDPPRLIKGLKFLKPNPSWTGMEYNELYREVFHKRGAK